MKKLRIAVVGPESSGKSTLVRALASAFGCDYTVEYAEVYLERLDRKYSYEDILTIARQQKQIEDCAFELAETMLICDSAMLTNRIWSMDKFGKCEPWIEEAWRQAPYDLYLLCYPDLAWQPGPFREDAHRREYLFGVYRNCLSVEKKAYMIIKGEGAERITMAQQRISILLEAF